MSLFKRSAQAPEETRSIDTVPWNVGGTLGAATTDTRALGLVPVYAAVRLLADSVSTLPVHAFRNQGSERVQVSTPALLRQPAASGSLMDWVHRAVVSLALHGNAYGLVTSRDGYGYPTSIEWLNPVSVSVDESQALPRYYVNGRPVPNEDIVHVAWMVRPGSVVGFSPLDAMRATVNTGLNAAEYGSRWFENGGVPPGTFKNSSKIVSPEDSETIKARLVASIRKGQPLVYGSDWDFTAVALPPETAQFVETQRLTATQIASIYGVPASMIGGETGGSMTYANVEQEALNFVTHTLRPWLVRLENAINPLLPNLVYVKFNADALIRTDTLTRHQVYAIDRQIGLRSINEMREKEDLPPITGGDTYAPTPPPAAPTQGDPNAPGN